MSAVVAMVTDESASRIALIVPTYRRPQDLTRCLQAIAGQERAPDQVIVVRREGDELTQQVLLGPLAAGMDLTIVTVREGGVVAALNAGLTAVDADIVAFTDDDAAPRARWLAQIESRFAADDGMGGLGGRDWVHQHGRLEDDSRPTVGRITWFGRCIGHHHLGIGPARAVDTLKGVNMSFRARALEGLRFDSRLRGGGAQVCNEMGVSLAVKRRGWKLVYDPEVAVDHYPAIRHDEDKRNTFSVEAIYNTAFNETLLLCEHFGRWRRYLFLAWAFAIGHRASPGLLQWVRALFTEPREATPRFRATWAARLAAWRVARC
ncbi:MAG TPA: glycosyltransferase [Steroidobacteraceae bacterium]|nr:glycosyltransferase [Steroidobacteraceae bacterium]